jgi:hypothetical protein
MTDDIHVDVPALVAYAKQLGYYESEADKFAGVVDRADVTDEAWGMVGHWAKQSYTDRLGELRSLLDDMKAGVESLSTKITQSAAVYQGKEHDTTIRFGRHEAELDGPL